MLCKKDDKLTSIATIGLVVLIGYIKGWGRSIGYVEWVK